MKGHLVPYLNQSIYRVKIIWPVLYELYNMGLFEGIYIGKLYKIQGWGTTTMMEMESDRTKANDQPLLYQTKRTPILDIV